MPDLYIDADACPVKDEAIRVAQRHHMHVFMVNNGGMRPRPESFVQQIVVNNHADAADDWIAEHVAHNDLVITADILLAARCLERGAWVLGPTGKRFSNDTIGTALAMRELNAHLRETGESKGYNASFTPRDRSNFLQMMEQMLQLIKKST